MYAYNSLKKKFSACAFQNKKNSQEKNQSKLINLGEK